MWLPGSASITEWSTCGSSRVSSCTAGVGSTSHVIARLAKAMLPASMPNIKAEWSWLAGRHLPASRAPDPHAALASAQLEHVADTLASTRRQPGMAPHAGLYTQAATGRRGTTPDAAM